VDGDELWSDSTNVGPLASGEEKTVDWEWESGNPSDVTIIVETMKSDENSRNNQKDIDVEVSMVHVPEISTFNENKEGSSGDKVTFDIVIRNGATGTDEFEIEMTGEAASWGMIANQMELKSDENREIELQLTIPEDTPDGDYGLEIHVTGGDVTETLELNVHVTDTPTNYDVEIELDPTQVEAVAGSEIEFSVTIRNTGDAEDTFDLESRGEWSAWVMFYDTQIFIGAGGEETVGGVINIPEDADDGNAYIEIWATSRSDQDKDDDKVIKVIVEELETGVTLTRTSVGLKTIAPGTSDVFEYTLVSDGNTNQEVEILLYGEIGEAGWAESSITEIELGPGGGTDFTVTVSIPEGTAEDQYRLEVHVMFGVSENVGGEVMSVGSVIVQEAFEENLDVVMCLTNATSGLCMTSNDFNLTIEANKIQTASVNFLVENRGNVDVEIAFELSMPDGTTGSDLYFDENSKEWRVAVSPAETTTYPLEIDVGDTMDWGTLAVIAREVLPGSYTFTVKMLSATETETGYLFETLQQVTVTIIVEGEVTGEEGSSSSGDTESLLPGPSFLSVILIISAIVYRRRK